MHPKGTGSLGLAVVFLVACGTNDATVDAPTGVPGDAPHGGTDGSVTAYAPGGIGEPTELAGMTLYHNQVRAMVDTTGVAGGPLPALQWDPNLAAYAATWAAMCSDTNHDGLVDHNPNRTNVAGYSYIGENIYASSGTASAMQAVQLWAAEKANYTYATNACSGVCGHYTQIVWRTTLKVGCALQNCPGLQYPSTIVCDYGPGGNFNGQSPY